MISKQTKILLLVGVICLGSALIWQNYSHIAFVLSHGSPVVEIANAKSSDGWDPSQLWVHQPFGSDALLLAGALGLLLTIPSLVGDIVRWRRHR